MVNCTNCPNCGAVRDPKATRCPYCETPYPKATAAVLIEPQQFHIDAKQIAAAVAGGIITPNEVRRCLGLPRV